MGIKRLLGLGGAYIGLCATLALVSHFASPSCRAETGTYDVAVVLGAAIEADGTLTPDTASRVAAAVLLYQKQRVDRLHMTGGGNAQDGTSIGDAMARAAIAAGVPARDVTAEGLSQSTLQNAQFSLPYLTNDTQILVVTEPYHMLRGRVSFWWAGRAVSGCAAPTSAATHWDVARHVGYETLAWGLNLIRAPLYSLAQHAGLAEQLGPDFLD